MRKGPDFYMRIGVIIIWIFVSVFVLIYYKDKIVTNHNNKEIAKEVFIDGKDGLKKADFSYLHKKNKDIVAYFEFEDIKTPIMQTKDNDYYKKSVTGKKNFFGSAFLNNTDDKEWKDCNHLIYGKCFDNYNLLKTGKKFYIYLENETIEYEIIETKAIRLNDTFYSKDRKFVDDTVVLSTYTPFKFQKQVVITGKETKRVKW